MTTSGRSAATLSTFGANVFAGDVMGHRQRGREELAEDAVLRAPATMPTCIPTMWLGAAVDRHEDRAAAGMGIVTTRGRGVSRVIRTPRWSVTVTAAPAGPPPRPVAVVREPVAPPPSTLRGRPAPDRPATAGVPPGQDLPARRCREGRAAGVSPWSQRSGPQGARIQAPDGACWGRPSLGGWAAGTARAGPPGVDGARLPAPGGPTPRRTHGTPAVRGRRSPVGLVGEPEQPGHRHSKAPAPARGASPRRRPSHARGCSGSC